MANRYAVASGDWSDTATWDGGTLPGVGDVVRPNGFYVEIDQDIEVGELRCDAESPASAGGGFTMKADSAERVITADIHAIGASNQTLRIDAWPATVTVNGDVTGDATSNSRQAIYLTGTTHLTVNGDVTGGGGSSREAIVWAFGPAPAGLTINGDVSTSGTSAGIKNTTETSVVNRSFTINGDVYGSGFGGEGYGVVTNHGLTVNGNLYGGNALNPTNGRAAVKINSTSATAQVLAFNGSIGGHPSLGNSSTRPALDMGESLTPARVTGPIYANPWAFPIVGVSPRFIAATPDDPLLLYIGKIASSDNLMLSNLCSGEAPDASGKLFINNVKEWENIEEGGASFKAQLLRGISGLTGEESTTSEVWNVVDEYLTLASAVEVNGLEIIRESDSGLILYRFGDVYFPTVFGTVDALMIYRDFPDGSDVPMAWWVLDDPPLLDGTGILFKTPMAGGVSLSIPIP